MILETIADKYLWFLVGILIINLYQKKYAPRSQKKRMVTLIIAALAMLWQIFIVIILSRGWPHFLAIPALALVLLLIIPLKKRLFVFKKQCPSCSKKLTFTTILNYDDNLCDDCWKELHPEPKKEGEEIVEESLAATPEMAKTVEEIDWDVWEPTEKAVVCYIIDKDRLLLIHKKGGLGAGLVNAPGGHIEPYETASEAAIREVKEETGITIEQVEHRGVLEFQFTDGLAMRGHVFFAYDHSGDEIETDEATPFWVSLDQIPYESMWEDDALWLPLALQGKRVHGRFIFDGQSMLSHSLTVLESEEDAL